MLQLQNPFQDVSRKSPEWINNNKSEFGKNSGPNQFNTNLLLEKKRFKIIGKLKYLKLNEIKKNTFKLIRMRNIIIDLN